MQIQPQVDKLVQELKHLFDDRLHSVCVYGSAAFTVESGHTNPNHADINVLVILETLDLSDFERASSLGKWWQKVAHVLPMFLSLEEWMQSKDVFALEYADIRDHHWVAYGEDIFNNICVDYDALRLVCELELHRKLIYLRQRLFLYRDQPEKLLDLLHHSINSFAALFRGVLRLKQTQEKPPFSSKEVFQSLEKTLPGFNATPFLAVLASKAGENKLRGANIDPVFSQVVQGVSHVVSHVDQCHGFLNPIQEGVIV